MSKCQHRYEFNNYCGCHVCSKCGDHAHVNDKTGIVSQQLARCFCGWNTHTADPEAMYQEQWYEKEE